MGHEVKEPSKANGNGHHMPHPEEPPSDPGEAREFAESIVDMTGRSLAERVLNAERAIVDACKSMREDNEHTREFVFRQAALVVGHEELNTRRHALVLGGQRDLEERAAATESNLLALGRHFGVAMESHAKRVSLTEDKVDDALSIATTAKEDATISKERTAGFELLRKMYKHPAAVTIAVVVAGFLGGVAATLHNVIATLATLISGH